MKIRLAGMLAIAMLICGVTPAAAAAPTAAPANGIAITGGTTMWRTPMTSQECAAAKVSVADCFITHTVTTSVTPTAGVRAAGVQAAAVGSLNINWNDREASPFWSVDEHFTATAYDDGYVTYTSETCNTWGILWVVDVKWCGGYPSNGKHKYWNQTNAGTNFTVSYGYQGSFITYSHGMRDQINPFNDHIYQDSW